MSKKTEKFPKHMMGKHCGYYLNADGSLKIAPSYTDRMRALNDEQKVIDDLAASFTLALRHLQAQITPKRQQLWNDIRDDYGLGHSEFTVNYTTGLLVVDKGKAE